MELPGEVNPQGWWQSYALDQASRSDLEAAATLPQLLRSSIVPGLLQTTEYARAMHEAGIQVCALVWIDEQSSSVAGNDCSRRPAL